MDILKTHLFIYVSTDKGVIIRGIPLKLPIGVLSTAAGVAKDQAEADEDMSLKQRLVLAAGSTLEGASGMVDNEIIAGAMEVGGELWDA